MKWDPFHTASPCVGMEQGKGRHLSFQTVPRALVVNFYFEVPAATTVDENTSGQEAVQVPSSKKPVRSWTLHIKPPR